MVKDFCPKKVFVTDFCGIFSRFLSQIFGRFLAGRFLALRDFWYSKNLFGEFLCTRKNFVGKFVFSKIFFWSVCVLKKIIFSSFGGGKNFFFASVYSLNPLFFGLRTHKTHFKGYFRHFVTFLVLISLL